MQIFWLVGILLALLWGCGFFLHHILRKRPIDEIRKHREKGKINRRHSHQLKPEGKPVLWVD